MSSPGKAAKGFHKGDIAQMKKKLKQRSSHIRAPSQTKVNKDDGGGGGDDFEAWMKSRQLLKPEDQLELTDAELAEEFTKTLEQINTNAPRNLVAYSFKEGAYVVLPPESNTVTLLQIDGNALHVDSEEARIQVEEMGDIGYPLPQPRTSLIDVRESHHSIQAARGDEEGEEEGEEEGGEEEDEGDKEEAEAEDEGEDEEADEGEKAAEEAGEPAAVEEAPVQPPRPQGTRKRKLVNQFNFCERAALTYVYPRRSVDTQTIPPPRSQYGGTALQWIIFDSYAYDYKKQMKEKERTEKKAGGAAPAAATTATGSKPPVKKRYRSRYTDDLKRKYLKSWQIVERMINQNIYDEISNDYRYWEDPADEYRENEGTLLPLWKFMYERTKKMSVTDILFNPHYYDLFGVCYGSHEYMRQPADGACCLFTVKNPSYPDYIIMKDIGVMCCDIHPKYPFLLALGLYDGNVHVHNLREMKYWEPLYVSVGVPEKHAEAVNEIRWGPDLADGEINFYSVSTDGRVFNYVLMQNKLGITKIITLFLENGICPGPDGTEVKLRSCGTCMRFHPTDPEIFLIGTEEGFIYKCSIAFSSKYLMTYEAHHLSVYRIDFNFYNTNIFISCSGDWRVKVWEDLREDPLFVFDLGAPVGDVKWAPYSSTVFAAVTQEGKVYVYDLNINKYKPICVQAVVPKSKNKCTRLAFNMKLPFLVVGDDKGCITSLKLSPNLRVMVKPPKKQLTMDQNTLQIQKLDKLLSLVRELPEGAVVKETTTTVQS